jgi:hypothetical protein
VKKHLLYIILLITLVITSCEKDYITLDNSINNTDTTKNQKVYNIEDIVNKLPHKKEEPKKKRKKRLRVFKLKLKKSN